MYDKVIKSTTPFSPKEAGYSEERLEVLNNHFLGLIEKKEIMSASYCLFHDNKLFADAAMGNLSCDEKDERRFMPDTIFRIASITKVITATAILKLVEDGKIRLDQCVGEILEEFNTPPFNTISIVHLLTHTSGIIQDEGVYENKYYEGWWKLVKEHPETEWIKAVLKKGLQHEPGKQWAYSTVGFMILGEIITRVSGMFCHDYIEKNIFEPCEMTDTCFGMKPEFADRYNLRTPRMEEVIKDLKSGEKIEDDGWDKIPSTGSGVYSTCRDLIKFGSMMLNNGVYNGKRIIGRKALEAMRRIHTAPEVRDHCWGRKETYHPYGLGPDIVSEADEQQIVTPGTICHEGYGTCCIMIDFKENFMAVWSAQFYGENWYIDALRNVASIMWSGLE